MTTSYFKLGSLARGSIQPRPDQQERLEELTDRIYHGEFHVPMTSNITPARCVDGRSPAIQSPILAPNAAGGTETLFVADDLTVRRFSRSGTPTLDGYTEVVNFLKQTGHEVGGHTDTHAEGEKSGCGANDKLAQIYSFIAENAEALRELAQRLGVNVGSADHKLIRENAKRRTAFSSGAELLRFLRTAARPELLDVLEGDHNEVIAVINTVPRTTLNRQRLTQEFGSNYQAFNVDVWAFEGAARVLAMDESKVARYVAAMVYYNLATTLVLAGPELRVMIRK